MASASDRLASGAGLSLPRLAMALRTMASGSPSFAGRSNSTVSTPALVRCAAICAPMTPAPRTAARRTSNFSDMFVIHLFGKENRRLCLEAGGGKADQFQRCPAAVLDLADARRALDQAEAGHRVGQRAAQEIQAPVQRLLVQVRQPGRQRARELALDVAIALGQEVAQIVVVLGVGPRDDADEGMAMAVLGQVEGRLDESGQDRFQLARPLRRGGA